jgi:hypothetical protein
LQTFEFIVQSRRRVLTPLRLWSAVQVQQMAVQDAEAKRKGGASGEPLPEEEALAQLEAALRAVPLLDGRFTFAGARAPLW